MLRLITGHFKGRRLQAPPSAITRPTTDRVRESIFHLITSYYLENELSFDEITALDAFAGSGALGFEALSRGASHVTFFEQNPKAFGILRENLLHLKCTLETALLQRLDCLRPPKKDAAVDLVFLDPPYGKNLIIHALRALAQKGWINEKTLLILEMDEQDPLKESLKDHVIVEKSYGGTKVILLTGYAG